MNDERKPKQEPIGHATIPPALRPYLGATAQGLGPGAVAVATERRADPTMDAAFAQINDAIGEDVQEIDPSVGAGNASRYVGPALVPDGARGKAFTAKVKIIESHASNAANDAQAGADDEATADPAPPSSRGGVQTGGRTARLMARAATGAEHAPPVAVPERGPVAPGAGPSRGRAIVVTIGALAVVVAVGVWVVAKGPHEVSNTSAPSGSGSATAAPAVPAVPSSAAVVVAVPTAPLPTPHGTVEVDAGASVAPSVPTGAAPYKPKGAVVKGEDPYDAAAPLPVKTAEPVLPPPSSAPPTPAPTSSSWF